MARITVVNDSPEFLALMRDILEGEGHMVTTAIGDRPGVVTEIANSAPDLIVIDFRMGEAQVEGWDVAQRVRTHPSLAEVPVLIASADARGLQSLVAQLGTQGVATVTKPFALEEIVGKIDRLLGTAGAEAVDQSTA